MAWTDRADRCARHVRDRLGLSATVTPVATGIPESVTGIFHDPSDELELVGGVVEAVQAPALDLRLADLSAAPLRGDTVELVRAGDSSASEFLITHVKPCGVGTVRCVLTLAVP